MNPNNSSYKQHNQQQILMALIDGQWHRIMELKEETKLSPRTLYKHLNELEKELHWIERKENTESGEYPHPVLYKATRSTISYATYVQSVIYNADEMETRLKEAKDPLQILNDFHKLNEYYFTCSLLEIQKRKHMTQKQLDGMTNFFLLSPYETYIKNLITAFAKAVQFGAQFDINKLRQRHNVWGIWETQ